MSMVTSSTLTKSYADGRSRGTLTPSISGWVSIVGGLMMGVASILIVVSPSVTFFIQSINADVNRSAGHLQLCYG